MRLRFFHEKARKTFKNFKKISWGLNLILHEGVVIIESVSIVVCKMKEIVKMLRIVDCVPYRGSDKMVRVENNGVYRPLLILAYADSAHAAQCGRFFRRHGWEVRLVASAAEARRLLTSLSPRAIVLDTELPDESGWLASAKMTQEDPSRNVILLAPHRAPESSQHLANVGARALVTRQERMEILAEAIMGKRLAEAV